MIYGNAKSKNQTALTIKAASYGDAKTSRLWGKLRSGTD
jgi:hypothetical protein